MGFPETFKALSDPVRREILTMLRDGRMSAGEIASKFDMTAATVSYHLKQLKQADLIYETKDKKQLYVAMCGTVPAAKGYPLIGAGTPGVDPEFPPG